MKATICAQAILNALPFQSTEVTRYYLGGVALQPGRAGGAHAIATDGHVMLVQLDPAGAVDGDLIVAFDKPALAALKRQKADGEFVRYVRLEAANTGPATATVFLATPDDALTVNPEALAPDCRWAVPCTIIDGAFPDWRRVVPAEKPAPAAFNGKNVEKFARLAGARGIAIHADGSGPALVSISDDPAQPAMFGIIMPYRCQAHDKPALPAWLEAPKPRAKPKAAPAPVVDPVPAPVPVPANTPAAPVAIAA